MTRLRRVGFYRELAYGDPSDPALRESLAAEPAPHEREIAAYLRSAPRLAIAPMVTYDVLDPHRALGTPSLHTDGAWAWPSDLAYYVETYHLQLPAQFLEHIRARNWLPPREDELPAEMSVEGFVEMPDSVTDADEQVPAQGGHDA